MNVVAISEELLTKSELSYKIGDKEMRRYWCVECFSDRIIRNGSMRLGGGTMGQNYLCSSCGHQDHMRIDSYINPAALAQIYGLWKSGQEFDGALKLIMEKLDRVIKHLHKGHNETWKDIIDLALSDIGKKYVEDYRREHDLKENEGLIGFNFKTWEVEDNTNKTIKMPALMRRMFRARTK